MALPKLDLTYSYRQIIKSINIICTSLQRNRDVPYAQTKQVLDFRAAKSPN